MQLTNYGLNNIPLVGFIVIEYFYIRNQQRLVLAILIVIRLYNERFHRPKAATPLITAAACAQRASVARDAAKLARVVK